MTHDKLCKLLLNNVHEFVWLTQIIIIIMFVISRFCVLWINEPHESYVKVDHVNEMGHFFVIV